MQETITIMIAIDDREMIFVIQFLHIVTAQFLKIFLTFFSLSNRPSERHFDMQFDFIEMKKTKDTF